MSFVSCFYALISHGKQPQQWWSQFWHNQASCLAEQKRGSTEDLTMNCLWSSSRLFLQLFLTFTFFFFFGLPAVKKYLSREVMVVRTVKKNWEGLVEPPAITINARNPITKYGWKENGLNFWEHLRICLENNASDPKCYLDRLYSQNDVFNDIILGYTRKESLKNLTSL